jgi:hypothetical protein
MKNILKAKALSPSSIKKIDKYFKSKSNLFDTFDEIFLHIGFIINKTNRSPQELIELAVEDIVFVSNEELQEHVSLYFAFHNSVVKFLDLLENAKDGDEVVEKSNAVVKALYELCGKNDEVFQTRLAEECLEIASVIFDDYDIDETNSQDDAHKELAKKIKDKHAVSTLIDVLHAIPKLQEAQLDKKASLEAGAGLLLLCMIFHHLRKENIVSKIWKKRV